MSFYVEVESPARGIALGAFRMLGTWRERLRGLLGTGADAEQVVLMRCSSVHTHGMRYAIDVAFVSGEGWVLRSVRGLAPGHAASAPGTFCVFERPAREGAWFVEGERIRARTLAHGSAMETEEEVRYAS